MKVRSGFVSNSSSSSFIIICPNKNKMTEKELDDYIFNVDIDPYDKRIINSIIDDTDLNEERLDNCDSYDMGNMVNFYSKDYLKHHSFLDYVNNHIILNIHDSYDLDSDLGKYVKAPYVKIDD